MQDNNATEPETQETDQETPTTLPETSKSVTWSRKKIIATFVIAALTAATLGALSQTVLSPILKNSKAQTMIENIGKTSGKLTPVNTKLETFVGQQIANANINQKALSNGLEQEESAVFIFNNGKSDQKHKTLDVYIDFNSQFSRDFFLLNSGNLKNMVERSNIELRISPVQTGSTFSMYAAEAVSEAFATKPNLAWDFIIDLLKLSATIDTDKNDEIVEEILKVSESHGLTDISKDSILNGTFASWIIAVGDDAKLQDGYYPPLAFINESLIDPDMINYNDATAFMTAVLK